MGVTARKRLIMMVGVVAVLAFVLGPGGRTVSANFSCFHDLKNCYTRAAWFQNFWDMWAGGLDCELTAVDCIRRAIIGR